MDLPVGFGAGFARCVEEAQAVPVIFEVSGVLIAAVHDASPAIAYAEEDDKLRPDNRQRVPEEGF
jgi:hypothetical protein